MINLSNKQLKAIQNGEISVKEMAEQIANVYPAKSIAEAFVELLTVQPLAIEKIKITEQQFKALFKIKGVADVSTGKAEKRGRPSKKVETSE